MQLGRDDLAGGVACALSQVSEVTLTTKVGSIVTGYVVLGSVRKDMSGFRTRVVSMPDPSMVVSTFLTSPVPSLLASDPSHIRGLGARPPFPCRPRSESRRRG